MTLTDVPLPAGSRRSIGVLTFHRCINQGSYWQARCLVEGLRARGHDAVLLDHHMPAVNVAEWRCALRPTLPIPVPATDRPLYKAKVRKFSDAVSALPLSAQFDLRDPDAVRDFDTVVVGSDEVWNLSHPWYGGNAVFWGEGIDTPNLVSYAASFGNYASSRGLADEWVDRLASFESISVRDDNSRDIVASVTGREPAVVLDPCLQFAPNIPDGEWYGPDEPFVAVYGHNFSDGFSREVRRWAEARRYPLVSVSYRNDWADHQWIDAGPADFAQAISRAAAVATNFFHGCVFAIGTGTPFVCESSSYRSNKVRGLMASVGGARHLVSDATPSSSYDGCLDGPLDPAIHATLAVLRARSSEFLDAALL